jgi:hypothetical protein
MLFTTKISHSLLFNSIHSYFQRLCKLTSVTFTRNCTDCFLEIKYFFHSLTGRALLQVWNSLLVLPGTAAH